MITGVSNDSGSGVGMSAGVLNGSGSGVGEGVEAELAPRSRVLSSLECKDDHEVGGAMVVVAVGVVVVVGMKVVVMVIMSHG